MDTGRPDRRPIGVRPPDRTVLGPALSLAVPPDSRSTQRRGPDARDLPESAGRDWLVSPRQQFPRVGLPHWTQQFREPEAVGTTDETSAAGGRGQSGDAGAGRIDNGTARNVGSRE